jgi:ABC-2 type transport system permease protein
VISVIAKKELKEIFRDGRFLIAAAAVLLLLSTALLLGWRHYIEIAAERQQAQRLSRRHWLNQGVKNPHSAAHFGVYAFKPRTPLSLIDHGLDPWTGVTVWLEAHKQNEFQYKPAQDGVSLQRFGELTAAATLQILLPLLIILMAHSSLSGERESGALRLLVSLGLRPATLVWGKFAGLSLAFALLIVPAVVLGVLALGLSSSPEILWKSLPRMGLLAITYVIYFVGLLAVCLAVSARAGRSQRALILLLGFWILNSIAAPRLAADLATAVAPTPSAFEFQHGIELALRGQADELDFHQLRTEKLKQQLLQKYNVTRIEDLPVDFRGIALQAGEDYGNQVFDRAYSNLWAALFSQETIHYYLSAFAPLLAVRSLSMALAGTDLSHHVDFAKKAEEYRRLIQRIMNDDITYGGARVRGVYVRGADLWTKVPEFRYAPPSVAWVLQQQWLPALMLIAWAGAAVLGMLYATKHLPLD